MLVTLAAFIGMILGVMNFLRSLHKDKVRLKVIPKAVLEATYDEGMNTNGYILSAEDFQKFRDLFAFEIVNLSSFPVTVDEVGLKSRWRKSKLALLTPIAADNGVWPRELQPRKSVLVYAKLSSILDAAMKGDIGTAYVKTVCNHIFYGNSKALKLLINHIENQKKL